MEMKSMWNDWSQLSLDAYNMPIKRLSHNNSNWSNRWQRIKCCRLKSNMIYFQWHDVANKFSVVEWICDSNHHFLLSLQLQCAQSIEVKIATNINGAGVAEKKAKLFSSCWCEIVRLRKCLCSFWHNMPSGYNFCKWQCDETHNWKSCTFFCRSCFFFLCSSAFVAQRQWCMPCWKTDGKLNASIIIVHTKRGIKKAKYLMRILRKIIKQ